MGLVLGSSTGGQHVISIRSLEKWLGSLQGRTGKAVESRHAHICSPCQCPSPSAHVLDHAAAAHSPLSQRLQPAAWGPLGFWNHQWIGESPAAWMAIHRENPHLHTDQEPSACRRDRIQAQCGQTSQPHLSPTSSFPGTEEILFHIQTEKRLA